MFRAVRAVSLPRERMMFIRLAHSMVADKLEVDDDIVNFVRDTVRGTGVSEENFWKSMAQIQKELGPRNAELLQTRRDLQDKIDEFYKSRGDMRAVDDEERLRFLQEINYILPPASQFSVSTQNVDEEIANIPAPQLVCPIDNDRFIVNAGNARWGSLLDAFYGTDAIPPPRAKSGAKYDEQRGARVFAEVHRLLDKIFPLTVGSWGTVSNVEAEPGKLEMTIGGSGPKSQLRHPEKFVGYRIEGDGTTSSVLLKNNGLHVELQIDRTHPIGVYHAAGIKDVILESALTAIADAEDSACTVDAEDKVRAYKNWRGLMKGTISVPMKNFVRKQNPDLTWTRSDGKDTITLPGRVVLMCRNVGLHMYTDIVKFEGKETPEHFLDAMVTALCGLHNLGAKLKNSRTGSLYIVKPKMHGPDEVRLAVDLFSMVEDALGHPRNTIKMGIMDEERRLSINLRQSMYEARERIVFINTGFLDRTGDEIYTVMKGGPVLPKEQIKNERWLQAYERNNVQAGLDTQLIGKGQIGKGMWAAPDNMAEMRKKKKDHLRQGATTSWVPSPTAATIHALHYHEIDVKATQRSLQDMSDGSANGSLMDLLHPPFLDQPLSEEEILAELENNIQSILGYVVRWVGQGIGCSKVPDVNNVALMEDRATLRISTQLIYNWLQHGLTNFDQVMSVMKRMAVTVDKQNADDPNYRPMAPNTDESIEFQAAVELIKNAGKNSGYTEEVLSRKRREVKAALRKASSA